MEFNEKMNSETINSIRAITGVDAEIIDAVFKGLYIVNLQRISSGRSSMVLPRIGYIDTLKSSLDDSITFSAIPDDTFAYAVKQAYAHKSVSLKDVLDSIITAQRNLNNDELLKSLLTEDELFDLGIMD